MIIDFHNHFYPPAYLDALRSGFGVTIDSTAVRGVDVVPGDAVRALEELRAAGASIM